MSSNPAPPEGDARTRYERSLPQRVGAAKTNLVQAKDSLRARGRDIAAAQTKGRLDLARELAEELPALRESIRLRQEQLDQLLEEARGDGQA